MCTGVLGKLISKGVDKMCTIAFDAEIAAACELFGLGPEDPAADACVVAMIWGCSTIYEELVKGIVDPSKICVKLNM